MRVLIVEDHPLFVDALSPSLARLGATEISVAHTGADGIAEAQRGPIDLALVDIGLPDRSGLSVGCEILALHPDAPVVALTAVKDAMVARHAMKFGFAAYLPKDMQLDKFERVVASVLSGHRMTVPTTFPTSTTASDHDPSWGGADLTPRELEVLTCLVDGCTGPVIAERLGITRNTVRTHIQSILTKLQVHSRLEAAAFAVHNGLVDVSSRGASEARAAVGNGP